MIGDAQVAASPSLRALLRERRIPTAFVVLLVTGGTVLAFGGTPSWWLGASFFAGATFTLWHAFPELFSATAELSSRPRTLMGRSVVPGAALLELLYLGTLIGLAIYMMRDVFWGVRPISHDHTVHFVKAWQLHEQFLPQARLHGWSHRWFAGYPVDYLYPIGTDLFVNAVYLATFGMLSMQAAYGAAFVLGHVLTGYAGYRFGRMVGGPHVGFITGMLMLTDMSAFRYGGWAYSIQYGVWPQALSLAFALLATSRLRAIFETRKLRDVGMFALWMGASIVTHPIELVYTGLLLAVAPLAAAFSPTVKASVGSLRLIAAYLLALLVSCAWLLPFLSTRDQVTPMGLWWDSTYEMGKHLLTLDAFPGTLGFVLAFGIPAAIIMLRSRNFVWMFTAFMALVIPAFCSSTFIDELHLANLSGSFAKIQWLRMSSMAKPFWFAMAGYFVVVFLRKSRELVVANMPVRTATPDTAARGYLREVILCMVVSYLTLPVLVPMCQSFFTSNIAKALTTEGDRARDPDRAALVAWLKKSLPRGDGFYRVCVNTGHDHDLMDIAAEIPVPVYKRGFTPAENFIYKVNQGDAAVLEAVNVRFLIAEKPMPEEQFELLVNFGMYRVYRFKRWSPRPYVITQGRGQIKLERFSDDEIILRAAPGSSGKLRLNVSYFPRWHAYRDGKRVGMWPSALPEARMNSGFMTVMLEPGVYRFAFERSALDRVSFPLTLLGLAFVLLLVFADRRGAGSASLVRRASDKLTDAVETLAPSRVGLLVAVVALGFGGVTVLGEWQPRLALEELSGLGVKKVRYDFLERLSDAHAHIEYRSVGRRCKRFVDRFVCRDQNGNLDEERFVASTPAEIEEYRMVRCIRARPENDATLVIDYGAVPAGDAIVGYFGVERAGRLMNMVRPVDFRIFVDGKPTYAGATESDSKMHWFEAKVGGAPRDVNVTFAISALNVTKRFFCFYAQMADTEKGAASGASTPRRFADDSDEDEESR